MKTKYVATFLLVAALVFSLTTMPTNGHRVFEKTLEKNYEKSNINASCYLCHVRGEEKTTRNDFGKLFAKQFEGENFSETWNELDREARKEYEEKHMIPAFEKALKKVKKMKNKEGEDGVEYDTLIKELKLEGLRKKRTKKKK